jgi:hypothetical protein
MTTDAARAFDLNEQMVETLEREFGPEALRKGLQTAKPADLNAFFADFGRRWMERVLELGETYDDRTYQVLRAAVAKTGHFGFPFVGERFIEIAYLSTQPVYTLPIVENGARGLIFKMPFCGFHKVLREELGDDVAAKLHCKAACLNACDLAFARKGFKVNVEMEATMPVEEYCQFAVRLA